MKQNQVYNDKLFIIYFAAVCTKPNYSMSKPMMNNISFFSFYFLSSFIFFFCVYVSVPVTLLDLP
jgi:hypothetical protein